METQDSTRSSASCFPRTEIQNIKTSDFLRPTGISGPNFLRLADAIEGGDGYTRHKQRKRHGGTRTILVPVLEAKVALKLLRLRLQQVLDYTPPSHVFGYVAGRGIVGNARIHLGQEKLLTVDLRDFFGSVGSTRVRSVLERAGLEQDLVEVLLRVLLVREALPAGFSTSPYLSNVVFESADAALAEYCAENALYFSRYADDLTFSGSRDQVSDGLLSNVSDVLLREGWDVNSSKTRFMQSGGPQYVTGLYVGDPSQPHLPRRTKRRLRQLFHYVVKYGYENCQERHVVPNLAQLRGWFRHLYQVDPDAARRLIEGASPVDHWMVTGFGSMPVDEDESVWDELLDEIHFNRTH